MLQFGSGSEHFDIAISCIRLTKKGLFVIMGLFFISQSCLFLVSVLFDLSSLFVQLANMKTHERLHTGDLKFMCSECGKCFNTKSNLVRHQCRVLSSSSDNAQHEAVATTINGDGGGTSSNGVEATAADVVASLLTAHSSGLMMVGGRTKSMPSAGIAFGLHQ